MENSVFQFSVSNFHSIKPSVNGIIMVTGATTKLKSAKSKKMWEKKKGQLGAQ